MMTQVDISRESKSSSTPTNQNSSIAPHSPGSPHSEPISPGHRIGHPGHGLVPASASDTFHVTAAQAQEIQKQQQHIRKLQELLREHEVHIAEMRERENGLNQRFSELEREHKRNHQLQGQHSNVEYLKNVIVKYIETEEHENLFPLIATMLQLSPEETQRIKKKRESRRGLFSAFF